ncbi:MAG: FliH/SctL family protein [Pseudomonadota bacterium]
MDHNSSTEKSIASLGMSYRVIKADDAAKILEASNVIGKAKLDSVNILTETEKEAKNIIEKAQQKSQEIIENAKAEAEKLKESICHDEKIKAEKQLNAKTLNFMAQLKSDFKKCDTAIIDLVFKSLEKIIGHFKKEDIFLHIIKEGIADLDGQIGLKLRVHPSDETIAADAIDQLSIHYTGRCPIDAVELSSNVEPGQCVLVSEGGILDISLDSQFSNILDSLGHTESNTKSENAS